jgi:hypothetical protein
LTGSTVPSPFEVEVIATSFTRPRASAAAYWSRRSRPSSSMSIITISAPTSFASCCQGTKFEWCSRTVLTMRSPALMCSRPQV